MAQYNYNSYRRRPSYRQPINRGDERDVNENRIFVQDAPVLPYVPGGVDVPTQEEIEQGTQWLPGHLQAANNPFFKGGGEQIEYQLPQGTQYYGDGTGEEPVDKLAYAYGEQARSDAAAMQAKAQAAADTARARANEGILTGDINPSNPAAAAVLDAMGVEVTAGMMGRNSLAPDEVIKNVYGPRVASGSLPSAEDDLVIQSRRRREAEARAKIDSYVSKNFDALTVNDIAGFWQQHYQAFPEFAEGRTPPKTREEMFTEQRKAEEDRFKQETQGVAKALGLQSLPMKRDKDGSITTDVGTLQMIVSTANAQKDVRSGAGRELTASADRRVKALKAQLGAKPANLRSVEGRQWLAKEAQINAQIAQVYTDLDKQMSQTKAIPDPNHEREVVESEVGAATPEGPIKFASQEELAAGISSGTLQPDVPFYSPGGNLVIMDENGKFHRVNR